MVNSTENKSQELQNEEKTIVETPKKVPAPIPDVNVWELKKQSVTTQPVNNNPDAWPEPKEAIQQEEQTSDKKSSHKSVGRGNWRPYTPTIIHVTPSGGRRNNNNTRGRPGKNNGKKTKPTDPVPEKTNSTSSLPVEEPKEEEKPTTTTSTPVLKSFEPTIEQRPYMNGRGAGGMRRGGRATRYPRYFNRPNPSAYLNLDPETLKSYICQQIEYYFSIDNLCKDLYLRGQMDSEGYVPLTLIAGFNRVRGLTADMSLVRASLELSKILEYIKEKDILRKKEGWETWILPKST